MDNIQTNTPNNQYDQLAIELNKLGESINDIYQILKPITPPIDYQTVNQLTQERKTQITRDNRINTILK
jgi:hypothetical protein